MESIVQATKVLRNLVLRKDERETSENWSLRHFLIFLHDY